jgi:cell wall-associated NlpC family hydrolase
MPSPLTHLRRSGRFAVASAVLGGTLAVALAAGPSSSAQSERLEAVRAEQDQVRAELAEQNAAVDALIGEVSELRERQRTVAAELAEQEAELAAARGKLAAARDALAETKRRLKGSIAELEGLLISIYRYGEIDMVTTLLSADGVDDAAAASTYLERVRDYETGVVGRVRDLRAAAGAHVVDIEASIERMETARAAIAERQEALAASRAALAEREAALRAAEEERREQLADLAGEERSLVRALATPAPAPTPADGDQAPVATVPGVAPPGGSAATLNADGTATAPGDAPQAVKEAIAAANAISDRPYQWGGGHGSFESAGYDCSGAVSYALHGGGFLSSPLDSTGLMTFGESGPGNWITVYANPGHAYVVIAGLRFDTSGGAGPRWQGPRDPSGFVAMHPPGY